MSRVEVTSFSKQDNGSGKKIDVAFRNESDDLFYDFVNFYSGDRNLDTELLDLAPGEEETLSLDLDHIEKPLKIAQDNNSTVIYSEDSEQTSREQMTGDENEQTDPDEQKKNRDQGTEEQNDKPEGHQQTEQASEEEKNRFDRVMEGEEEIDLPETEALAEKVPDLSKTVKEMKQKTVEGLEKEKDKIQDRQTVEEDQQEQKSEEEEEEEENHERDEASTGKPSMLKSILHPFTRGRVESEEPEEQDEGEREEEAPEDPEEASEDDHEEQQDGQQQDLSVTEKNDYSTERMTTGVINLDNKIEGGFVKGTMNLITGKTGTGKTAFCSNFIWEGAKKGEPGVYVTTEEREEDILEDINSMFGWDFDSLEEQDKVRVLSIKPVFPSQSMDNISRIVRSYISDLLDQVNEAIEEIGAERVVIDSVSLVQMFIQDEYMSRVALSSLMNNLREAGVTAVLVGSIPETSEGLSKQGIIEYLVDTVILLEFVPVAEDYNRTLKIRKMRRTDHDTDIFPFEVTADGLKVHEAYESI